MQNPSTDKSPSTKNDTTTKAKKPIALHAAVTSIEEKLRNSPVEAFFIIWQQQATGESKWKTDRENGTLIPIDEIIKDAMKDPVKEDGTGGNLSAQILRKKFDIDVTHGPDQQKTSSKPHHKAYKDALERAWNKIDEDKKEKEANFVSDFFSNHTKDQIKSRLWSFSFWSGWVKTQPDKITPVSIVEHSRKNWITRNIPFLTYSGNRTYKVLFEKYGIDTRNDKRSSADIADALVRALKK